MGFLLFHNSINVSRRSWVLSYYEYDPQIPHLRLQLKINVINGTIKSLLFIAFVYKLSLSHLVLIRPNLLDSKSCYSKMVD